MSESTLAPSSSAVVIRPPSRGRDERWIRPSLCALLAVTAVAYLWDLGASGWANDFYAAAAQAGTQSWKALLFASLDPGNVITVDKPPAALWVMGLSGRIFGFSSWSLLVPQALMGVASVALLYAAVRRWAGPRVGLAAAAVLAFTPGAVLMFRFDNPDALLVLLMVAAGYAVVRAVDAAATRAGLWWLLLAGTLIGFGFLTKMLQVLLVVPALAGVYLLAADTPLRRRIGRLLAAGAAMVVSAGWYVVLVALWPAGSRPYIGGSTDNSLLQLALGYNGLSRIFGHGGPGGPGMPAGPPPGGMAGFPPGGFPPGGPGGDAVGMGGAGGPPGFGGGTGVTRMFDADWAGNIAWLLPAALIVLVAGLWLTRRATRTDRARAALLLWGGWLLVTGLVFSFMSGIVHPYYSVAMAPGLAGALAVGTGLLWQRWAHRAARLTLAVTLAVTAAWSTVLLARTPEFLPWLRVVLPIAGVLAAVLLALPPRRCGRVTAVAAAVLGLIGGAGGASAYAVQTALTPHNGPIVAAGPARHDLPGGGPPGGGRDGPRGLGTPLGGPGAVVSNSELTALLRATHTRWAAATAGAQGAAGLQLSSGKAVMAIGGFSGGDPAPTLARFQSWVAQGQVHWFVEGRGPGGGQGPGGPPGGGPDGPGTGPAVGGPAGFGGPADGRGESALIRAWVAAHYTPNTVGGEVVYDLTAAAH
jgi:4-amino-4-deoxy-L-arabinose transferase-like glycosyltransferase